MGRESGGGDGGVGAFTVERVHMRERRDAGSRERGCREGDCVLGAVRGGARPKGRANAVVLGPADDGAAAAVHTGAAVAAVRRWRPHRQLATLLKLKLHPQSGV